MALSFWWPGPIQESTKSCLIRTKEIPVIRKLHGFQEPCVETRVNDQILEQKILLVLLILRKLQEFQEYVPGTRAWDQYIFFYYLKNTISFSQNFTLVTFSRFCDLFLFMAGEIYSIYDQFSTNNWIITIRVFYKF